MKRSDLQNELMRLVCRVGSRHWMGSRLDPQSVFDLRRDILAWLDRHEIGEVDSE